MIQLNGYVLLNETLEEWKKRFVPAHDIFFFADEPEFLNCSELTANTPLSFSLDEKTAFATWAICNEAKYYTTLSNEAFLKLTDEQKKHIIKEQWELGRGLVLSEEDVKTLIPDGMEEAFGILEQTSYFDERLNAKVFMIQNFIWESLSPHIQSQFILNYAALWTDERAAFNEINDYSRNEIRNEYQNLSAFFETFSSKNGPNCLAAAAAAFNEDISVIREWMHPERFFEILRNNQYIKINTEELEKQDVLVWKDKEGQAVHAATLLNSRYCFNKHGQTMFNPWQVLAVQDVIDSWSGEKFQMEIYRKN
jgi:hypothetical protein